MKSMVITNISTYTNWGMAVEQSLAFALTGEVRRHDHLAFDKGSDIPEYHMSVKSSEFSLASGKLMTSQTLEGQIDEFFSRVSSDKFAYVTLDCVVYIMDAYEFREFVKRFCHLGRESSQKGGWIKVKMRKENNSVRKWLAERVV